MNVVSLQQTQLNERFLRFSISRNFGSLIHLFFKIPRHTRLSQKVTSSSFLCLLGPFLSTKPVHLGMFILPQKPSCILIIFVFGCFRVDIPSTFLINFHMPVNLLCRKTHPTTLYISCRMQMLYWSVIRQQNMSSQDRYIVRWDADKYTKQANKIRFIALLIKWIDFYTNIHSLFFVVHHWCIPTSFLPTVTVKVVKVEVKVSP